MRETRELPSPNSQKTCRRIVDFFVALPPLAAHNTSIMNWIFCQRCGVLIPESTQRCRHCNAVQTSPVWTPKHWLRWVVRSIEKRIIPAPGQARTAKHWVWLLLLIGIATAGLIVVILTIAHKTNRPPRDPSLPPLLLSDWTKDADGHVIPVTY
jgi:hypothetical protein